MKLQYSLTQMLEADRTKRNGASVKSLVLGSDMKAKKATYAVTVNTLRHLPILHDIIQSCKLLESHPRLEEAAALVLW